MRFLKFFQCFFALDSPFECIHIGTELTGKVFITVSLKCHQNIVKGFFTILLRCNFLQLCIKYACNLTLLLHVIKQTDDRCRIDFSFIKILKQSLCHLPVQLLRKVLNRDILLNPWV